MIDLRPYVHNALRSIPNDKLWVQIVEEFDEDAKRRLRHWLGIDDDGVVASDEQFHSNYVIPHASKEEDSGNGVNASPRDTRPHLDVSSRCLHCSFILVSNKST